MNIKFNPIKSLESGASREAKTIERFNEYVEKNNITITTEDQIKQILGDRKTKVPMPGINIDEIIGMMKKKGMINVVKEPKKEKIIEKVELPKLEGLKQVDQIEIEQLEQETFKSPEELDEILQKARALEKEKLIESNEYYYAFEHFVKGGREEIDKDLKQLHEIQQRIKEDDSHSERKQEGYKIASVVECGVSYAVSSLQWFGDHVTVEPVCQFNDIKRGIDKVLQIKKEDESSFMGLGIDVTYRGLLSEIYKNKFFNLLKEIQDGYKPRVKYFTNHEGEKMKEFAVPKIILSFDSGAVKDFVRMIKNIDDPEIQQEFKESPQKFKVMNQILIQCEILSEFAEKRQNSIFKQYVDVLSSIKQLSWENPELEKLVKGRHEDEVAKHMKFLIEEFERTPQLEKAA